MRAQAWCFGFTAAYSATSLRRPRASLSRVPMQCPPPDFTHDQAELEELFRHLDQWVFPPDSATYLHVLQLCGKLKALSEGKRVHDYIVSGGLQSVRVLANGLISMYGKCGCVDNARKVFENITRRNVVSWNTMIAACAQNGNGKEGIRLFGHMQLEGVKQNKVTFLAVLSSCDSPTNLAEGKSIHSRIIDIELKEDVVIGSALVNMYGRCGAVDFARGIFNELLSQDVVSWNGLITMYIQQGYGQEALQTFEKMQLDGMQPNRTTFIVILNACASPHTLIDGRMIHAGIVEIGFESDVTVENALISMYGKCGSPEEAWRMFVGMPQRNVVSWNTMIGTNSQHGCHEKALQLFQGMQLTGLKPNDISYVNVLSACMSPTSLAGGKIIHNSAIDNGFETKVLVGNALLSMYSRCGNVEDAERMFKKIQDPTLVSWNAIIAAYDRHGHAKEALELFQQMQEKGARPNEFTFASIISACASMAILEEGKIIHSLADKNGFGSDDVVRSALVNMYGKCGSIEDACEIFTVMHKRSLATWTAMIAAYAQHGDCLEALRLFHQMLGEGQKPNEVSFVSIISACSHAGWLDEGCNYFSFMSEDHQITPMPTHYCCLIDLYGRAGRLDAAEDFITKMPFQPGSVEWLTLLGACQNYGDVERGNRAAQHVLELDPEHAAAIVSLSNIYGMCIDSMYGKREMVDWCVK